LLYVVGGYDSGGKAVGLSGKDGDLLRARQMVEKDIG
jgi:acetylglutamate kinase